MAVATLANATKVSGDPVTKGGNAGTTTTPKIKLRMVTNVTTANAGSKVLKVSWTVPVTKDKIKGYVIYFSRAQNVSPTNGTKLDVGGGNTTRTKNVRVPDGGQRFYIIVVSEVKAANVTTHTNSEPTVEVSRISSP